MKTLTQLRAIIEAPMPADWDYSSWRHGGWYVHNVKYPSGACGCVSRNYADRKWRIACDPRPFDQQPTFRTRDEAARAEYLFVADLARAALTRATLAEQALV